MPRVSVIVPAYNSARFIADTIESILNQTYGDREIIVIDDGSTDGTRDVVSNFVGRYPGKIRLIAQENAGPGAARNRGIREAGGAYIAFLDADDMWLPAKLERQVAIFEQRADVDYVYCDLYYVDGERKILIPGRVRRYPLPRGEITLEFFYHYFMFTSTVVARASCVHRAGFFREDINVGEDYDFFLRMSLHGRAEVIEEKLVEKRSIKSSLSNRDYALNRTNDLLILSGFLNANPAFYQKHRGIIAQKMNEYHFSLGYYWLHRGKNFASLHYLANSLRYKRTLKALKCLLLSLLPYPLVRFVKRMINRDEYDYPSV